MVSAEDFELLQVQAAGFTPRLALNANKLLSYLLSRWGDTFQGAPTVLPIPDDAPPEIPRIMLVSADQSYRLNVSPVRTDVFVARQAPDKDIELLEFLRWSSGLLSDLAEFATTQVGRLACVLTRIARTEDPGRSLAQHFCKDEWLLADGPLNRPEDFELHAHKRFRLTGEFVINSWVRCKTATVTDKQRGLDSRAVLVEQDFNTLPELLLETSYTRQQVSEFFEASPEEFRIVLARYFPSRH